MINSSNISIKFINILSKFLYFLICYLLSKKQYHILKKHYQIELSQLSCFCEKKSLNLRRSCFKSIIEIFIFF